jgi:cobalamin biosynthesis Mg chelatase CobN
MRQKPGVRASPSFEGNFNFAAEESIRTAIPGNDPATLRDATIAAVRAVVTGDPQQLGEARERAAQVVARAQNISVEDARTQVQHYANQYRQAVDQAKQQVTQAADSAAKTVSRAALLGAISLLLGGLAGWFGGRMGAAEPTLTAGPHNTRTRHF